MHRVAHMTKKDIIVKDEKLKAYLKRTGREGAMKDFRELLKRASRTAPIKK